MADLIEQYSKNFSPARKKEFKKRVFEVDPSIKLLSAIQLVLAEMRSSNNKGGLIGKPLGAGGEK